MKLNSKLLTIIVLFLFSCDLYSQNNQGDLRLHFQDAEYFLVSEDYSEALSAYIQLYNVDKQNANVNYRIGLCYLNIPGQKQKSIPYLEFATEHISEKYTVSTFNEKSAPPHTLFLLGTAYQINNQLDKAKKTFAEYKTYLKVNDVYEIDFVNKQIEACNFAVALMKEPLNIREKPLEKIVAQSRPSFNSILSGNEQMLIYMTEEKFYNAVWMIRKNEDRWSNPVNITPQIGSDGDCYPTSISPDGDTLYIVKLNNYGANIYVSYYDKNVWSKIDKLPRKINTRFWETHASISSDGRTLYFTSNRKNGFGGRDIYKSEMDEKGNWQDPINLGPIINTSYNEETPFISSDNKTLYFSSQGHSGMGGFDIFKSVRQDDDTWSVPVNIGYPVNTTDDNHFYYPLGNGDRALYAGNLGEEEPYSVVKEIEYLPPEIPVKEFALTGKIILEDDAPEIDPSVQLELFHASADSSRILDVNLMNGEFKNTIIPGKYRITASIDGYTAKTENIEVPKDFQRSEFNVELKLTPEKVSSGEYVIVRNILFDFDSYELQEEAMLDIERLYQVMQTYPDLYIEVLGHTDAKGSPVYNFELSKKRAHAVTSYLTQKGIDPLRFVTKGLGETQNIALNINPDGSDNPEGRKLNRNAEIRILQPDNYNIRLEPIPVPNYLKPSGAVEYTILLATSGTPLENKYFQSMQQISQNEVKETYNGEVYTYSLGRFYSRTQAEEIRKNSAFRDFPHSSVINSNTLGNISVSSSLISKNSEENEFGIQLTAFKNIENSDQFKSMSDTKIYKCDDGFYRVIFGVFETRTEAENQLSVIKSKGYQEAFVIDLNLIRKKALQAEQERLNEGEFTIQLKALKNQVGKNFFHNLSGVRVIEGTDGIFRYILGDFSTIEKAEIELNKIKEKGYNDAFIRSAKNLEN